MIAALFIGLLSPQIFIYLTDIILFSFAIIYLRYKKILLILLTLTLMVVVKAVISGDFLVWRYLLPMLQPFIVVGLILGWLKYKSSNDGYKLRFWLLLTVFLTSAINIIGHLDHGSYVLINNFWNGDARMLGDTGMTVASIASGQQRYSSIFAQPANAGLAFFSMLFALLISRKHLPHWLFLLSVIAVLFSGFSSKSSFFSAALLIYIIFNIIFRLLPMYSKSIAFVLVIAAPTLLTFLMFSIGISEVKLFGDDILGSRFQDSSYLYRLISLLDWTDYVFGIDGFGELGFTSFSQPGVVFLIFLPIVLIYAQQADSFRASMNTTFLSCYRSKSCAAS